MTQSIPNSFSSDDLQALMEQAAEREADQAQADDSDGTPMVASLPVSRC